MFFEVLSFSMDPKFLLALLITCMFSVVHPEVDYDQYTNEELVALIKLRPEIENIVHHDYQKEDSFLIRFLRVNKLNVNQAKAMISKTMKWRKENDIDSITSEKPMHSLMKQLQVSLGESFDRQGRPAFIISYGTWNIRKFMISGKKELLQRFQTFCYEAILSKARELGKSQYSYLIDVSGYSAKEHGCLACLPFFSHASLISENYYPNSARHSIMVNTPRIFEGVLQMLKSQMSETSKRDFQVFGANKDEWQPALLEIFSPDQLPPRYGGTKQL